MWLMVIDTGESGIQAQSYQFRQSKLCENEGFGKDVQMESMRQVEEDEVDLVVGDSVWCNLEQREVLSVGIKSLDESKESFLDVVEVSKVSLRLKQAGLNEE